MAYFNSDREYPYIIGGHHVEYFDNIRGVKSHNLGACKMFPNPYQHGSVYQTIQRTLPRYRNRTVILFCLDNDIYDQSGGGKVSHTRHSVIAGFVNRIYGLLESVNANVYIMGPMPQTSGVKFSDDMDYWTLLEELFCRIKGPKLDPSKFINFSQDMHTYSVGDNNKIKILGKPYGEGFARNVLATFRQKASYLRGAEVHPLSPGSKWISPQITSRASLMEPLDVDEINGCPSNGAAFREIKDVYHQVSRCIRTLARQPSGHVQALSKLCESLVAINSSSEKMFNIILRCQGDRAIEEAVDTYSNLTEEQLREWEMSSI